MTYNVLSGTLSLYTATTRLNQTSQNLNSFVGLNAITCILSHRLNVCRMEHVTNFYCTRASTVMSTIFENFVKIL